MLTDAPAPWPLTRLRLCRDVYHCTPGQLARERLTDILQDLAVMDMEARAEKAKQR